MVGWLKDEGFPTSGLKEGCNGVIGKEMSLGTVLGEGTGRKGSHLHSQVPALDLSPCSSPRSASCLGSLLGNRIGPLGKSCVSLVH